MPTGDDLFDDAPAPASGQPAPAAPGGTPPPAAPQPPAAPVVDAAALSRGFQELAAAMRGIGERVGNLEGRLTAPAKPAAKPGDPLSELYTNPEAFVESRVSRIVDQSLERLAPFLETVADSATSTARDRARTAFDRDFGDGVFDAVVGSDLDTALGNLPAASRAKGQYVEALVAGVLGGKLRTEEGRKAFNDARKEARERAPVPAVLTGSRAAPPRDQLTPEAKDLIAALNKSGIPFSQEAYRDALVRGNSEEDWGADWMKRTAYWDEPEKPAPAPGKAA